MLGARHPDTARSLNNLGSLLQAQGDYAGARPYYEEALAIRGKCWARATPTPPAASTTWALCCRRRGTLRERARTTKRRWPSGKCWARRHPDTARSLNNLGVLLQAQGRLGGSAAVLRSRRWPSVGKCWAPTHPDTAQQPQQPGRSAASAGRLAGARPYYEEALAIRGEVLGPATPTPPAASTTWRFCVITKGIWRRQTRLMREALAICEARLGPDHPDTVSSSQSLAVIEAGLRGSTSGRGT